MQVNGNVRVKAASSLKRLTAHSLLSPTVGPSVRTAVASASFREFRDGRGGEIVQREWKHIHWPFLCGCLKTSALNWLCELSVSSADARWRKDIWMFEVVLKLFWYYSEWNVHVKHLRYVCQSHDWHRQAFTLTVTLKGSSEPPISFTACFWSVWGNQNTQRKPTQGQGEHRENSWWYQRTGSQNKCDSFTRRKETHHLSTFAVTCRDRATCSRHQRATKRTLMLLRFTWRR